MPRLLTTAVMLLLMSFGLPGQAKNETAIVGRTTCLPEKDSTAEVEGSNETAVVDSGAPTKGSWPGTAGTKVHPSSLLFLLCYVEWKRQHLTRLCPLCTRVHERLNLHVVWSKCIHVQELGDPSSTM
jgi:hypothetical protein